jgi:hypothetical protein
MSASSTVLLVLTLLTVALKGAAAVVPRIPAVLARRTAGLAPALLAGLVVTQLTSKSGWLHADAKLAGVAAATALAALRAPLAICVIAGAVVAAVLRAAGIS